MKQLFIVDPIELINPSKDSSAALIEAAYRASLDIWVCTPADLQAKGAKAGVIARNAIPCPWIKLGEPKNLALNEFHCIWMRKDPPVDEAYLYATHLLEVAEREGVLVLNKPASLRAWNEKLGALRFSKLMAPTLVASRVNELKAFAKEQGEVVLKPLGGKGGQGVIRVADAAAGIDALLELVTSQEQIPVMMQKFLPKVIEGDKRILLINGKPLGAINRRPKKGDFRSNLALGGQAETTTLSIRETEICEELGLSLKREGLFFVGIDVIGGMLSEINVTSPTGIREVERLTNIPLADQVIERLLKDFP
ncbi:MULTISPECIES: glutathione synthase [unclassified Prochlorococcus]|uniref:glutathione synthase n=1 Tax=unclassified Prochlorococcus TaxID=2627481 RepID=UPI000533B236|nr:MULTISPECIES: glutathione synthase [unclassified Prochlorococcus]KGG16759.1 Glutathione synthetase [Prochlorococcus sp. MIT 0602]KGG18267.1 Glutathione synthetase [Prochlorococcus sp. MIT 0603]